MSLDFDDIFILFLIRIFENSPRENLKRLKARSKAQQININIAGSSTKKEQEQQVIIAFLAFFKIH